MIGSHNSGTGEPSKNWYHKLLIPFARCQRYSIREQLVHGSELFDLRVRKCGNSYVLCHGLWQSKSTWNDALWEIDSYGALTHCKYKVLITYEGKLSEVLADNFRDIVKSKVARYEHISLVQIAVKKPKWRVLHSDNVTDVKQGFMCLDFHSWHTLLPIPWLWSKFYKKKDDSKKTYTLVDFL